MFTSYYYELSTKEGNSRLLLISQKRVLKDHTKSTECSLEIGENIAKCNLKKGVQ